MTGEPSSRGRRSPRRSDRLGELAAFQQFSRLALRAPSLVAQQRGSGQPVLVLPGFGTSDTSTAALRGYLRGLGYRCYGWGLGVNNGNLERRIPQVAARLRTIAEERRQPVVLIGQSLGGVMARELAREHPELVAQVITFGSPMLSSRSGRPIACPLTVMYSKADQIVPWRACVDPSPGARNIEISSTHLGMGFDPDVWTIIARQLASVPASDPAPTVRESTVRPR